VWDDIYALSCGLRWPEKFVQYCSCQSFMALRRHDPDRQYQDSCVWQSAINTNFIISPLNAVPCNM
jgi:hypothetical protein